MALSHEKLEETIKNEIEHGGGMRLARSSLPPPPSIAAALSSGPLSMQRRKNILLIKCSIFLWVLKKIRSIYLDQRKNVLLPTTLLLNKPGRFYRQFFFTPKYFV